QRRSPEDAGHKLGSVRSKKHVEARHDRLRALPGPLAGIAFGVLGRLPDGSNPQEWGERQKLQKVSTVKLAEDASMRPRVLAAFFPALQNEVEAGWHVLASLPYTTGYNRRAFRAPGRREMVRDRRQSYLENLFQCLAPLPDDTLTADWLAAWAVHLGWHTDDLGYLFAGVIDAGGPAADTVLTILKDSAANRHAIGGPGG